MLANDAEPDQEETVLIEARCVTPRRAHTVEEGARTSIPVEGGIVMSRSSADAGARRGTLEGA